MASMICCSACLSFDRTLVLFDRDKYGSLFGNQTVIENVDTVCWECISMFRKLFRFKSKVLQAQECLKNITKVANLSPLSQLQSSTINYYNICCDQDIAKCKLSTRKHSSDEIHTDVSQIKSEDVTEEKVDEKNVLPKGYMFKGNCFKSDESNLNTEIDVSNIKLETEYDSYSDEVTVEKLSMNTELKPKTKGNVKAKRKNGNKKNPVKKKLIVTKDDYVTTKMTEEEMLAKREADRQSDRYKNKVKYRCELCIVGFFDKDLYDKHMRKRHSQAGSHKCSVCERRFSRMNFYKDHIEGHYTRYACRTCGHVGYKLSEMVAHDAKTHGFTRFKCKVCGEQFPSQSSLRFHRETLHTAPLSCECGKTFRIKHSLRVHMQLMHSDQKPKSQCPVCGTRVRQLTIHMRTHAAAPEAAYCAECDQRFSCIASYKSHLKYTAIHRAPDTLSYECELCSARYVKGSDLKNHKLLRHSTERPFKCDQCGKRKLRLHTLHTHEGVEKPKDKICHICGRGFNTKTMLRNHIRVHTGEKPFHCEICGAAFNQKSTLTTHTRGVHLKISPRPGRPQRP